jgi:hypothetical protein
LAPDGRAIVWGSVPASTVVDVVVGATVVLVVVVVNVLVVVDVASTVAARGREDEHAARTSASASDRLR